MGVQIMSDKLIIDCYTGEITEKSFTPDEILQRESEIRAKAEQAIIDSTIPTIEEQKQADFEIRTINLLIEMGLL